MAKYEYDYPHPAVATDCVVFGFDGRDLKVLLIRRGVEPYKDMWAFPGGFMRMDETAEQCAVRELREETGLVLTNVRQLGAFSGVNRDPRERIVSIAFYALARQSDVHGGDDAAGARWWPIGDIPQLAFDHDYILRQAMQRIRQDIHFEPVGFGLLADEFTVADLQRLYECILGVHFDRRNFYRKMLQTGILQEVDEDDARAERIRYVHNLLHNGHADDVVAASVPTAPRRYGDHGEMERKDIDDLFAAEAPLASSPAPGPLAVGSDSESPDDEPLARRPAGRKGKLFRFDKAQYDRLKDSGNFRLEF